MSVMKQQRLMFIGPVLVVLSVMLLWTYRPDWTFQTWTQYYPTNTQSPVVQKSYSSGHDDVLVKVNGTKTLLISAYLEHRTDRKEVLVLAIVLRTETVAYRCIFCCQQLLRVSAGFSYIHSDHFGFAYGTADIMCPVPSGCEEPTHITVTSAAAPPGDKHLGKFLEVKNQEAKSDSFPSNFTVCLSTMFDFTNVLQLVQSLEMLLILGVNRVVVYKTSCSPETQRILDYYQQRGELHYFGQIPALNDCLYRSMYRSRYVALHDIDELILPQTVSSWLQLLPLLEIRYGTDQCFMFENNVFPNSITLPDPTGRTIKQDRWVNVSGVNILDHLYHEPIISKTDYTGFKIIVNPRLVFSTSVHGLLSSLGGCSWVNRNIARMYHTRASKQMSLPPDQLVYDGRLLSYSATLRPAVDAVLTDTGFIAEHSERHSAGEPSDTTILLEEEAAAH
ncbi:uncharacterized protein si:zfos-464b6.2 isoform X2 [Acanthochromis polyacanthus]|uniref:uncharacterized protein si:zfos-464b6.2 isoform X2 n=1 Tax=Acanthochromis polyacanthus TaxID=80966 RepID=UPI0022344883|nr:uncharacterized protein si:zfos-464b6.2 isoform X2 [Acanthochromis polyacanthus]